MNYPLAASLVHRHKCCRASVALLWVLSCSACVEACWLVHASRVFLSLCSFCSEGLTFSGSSAPGLVGSHVMVGADSSGPWMPAWLVGHLLSQQRWPLALHPACLHLFAPRWLSLLMLVFSREPHPTRVFGSDASGEVMPSVVPQFLLMF